MQHMLRQKKELEGSNPFWCNFYEIVKNGPLNSDFNFNIIWNSFSVNFEGGLNQIYQSPSDSRSSSDLDICKIYSRYAEKYEETNRSFGKERIYRIVFKTEFNLNFHTTQQDTCQKYELLKGKIEACSNEEEKLHLRQIDDSHSQNAERARKKSKRTSQGILWILRNMYVYKLGFHNFPDGNVKMYVRDETTALRGAQEVASCILMHMEDTTTQKYVIAYSDACSGQRRNIKVTLTWMKIAQSSNNNIERIDYMSSSLCAERKSTFRVERTSQPNFISTKSLEESTTKRVKIPGDC
uniref:Uncharacterized protein n=1 Tax=Glossina morsitans morsitans TaxID=37546 RepID=A0A1B0FK37_GLOMM